MLLIDPMEVVKVAFNDFIVPVVKKQMHGSLLFTNAPAMNAANGYPTPAPLILIQVRPP